MSRARTIKPHFMFSRSMRAVSRMARLTFIQLWLVADDAGRVLAHPSALASRLYPGDAEARLLLADWLTELEDQHCIERYTVDRMDYLRIINWRKHQKIYHPTPSRLPARPVGVREDSGAIRESLGKNPQKPNAPGLSLRFPSDSRGESFFRRVTTAAQRALGRAG
jgi:hypothetical protein